MQVASLELSRELYELSGWRDVEFFYSPSGKLAHRSHTPSSINDGAIPAYDAGYLLRKLPQGKCTVTLEYGDWNYPIRECLWRASFNGNYNLKAETPEDCLAMLAIELFKAGILPISGRD